VNVTAEVSPARSAALKVLEQVRRGRFADQAFERLAGRLEDADRRLAQELAYGTLRLRGRLDHLIDHLVDGGIRSLQPQVLDILRMGAYQLLELDRVPAYAAVSESVESTRRGGHAAATRLVNAVLRRLAREGEPEAHFPCPAAEVAAYLSTWGSHPRWLVERWLSRWSEEEVARLVELDNERPSVYLSVAVPVDEALAVLSGEGIAAEPVGLVPGSIRIDAARVADALGQLDAVVQDPAAAAVVDFAAFAPGIRIVDLCAAPGGKAALAVLRGHAVLAFDVSKARLSRLRDSCERLGLADLSYGVADAAEPPLRSVGAALLDVPCTGTGTLSRHADARWRLTAAKLEQLVELQARMLDAASAIVEPGGLLVYATCSLEPEENEEQVESFLDRHRQFAREPAPPGAVAVELLDGRGELRITPQRHGIDGAYAARLRRRTG